MVKIYSVYDTTPPTKALAIDCTIFVPAKMVSSLNVVLRRGKVFLLCFAQQNDKRTSKLKHSMQSNIRPLFPQLTNCKFLYGSL